MYKECWILRTSRLLYDFKNSYCFGLEFHVNQMLDNDFNSFTLKEPETPDSISICSKLNSVCQEIY